MGAKTQKAKEGLAHRGIQVIGAGFIVAQEQSAALGLGTVAGLENHIRDYRHGRYLTATPRGVMVIDLFGWTEPEARRRFPAVYQHVLDNVKPERDQNNRDSYKKVTGGYLANRAKTCAPSWQACRVTSPRLRRQNTGPVSFLMAQLRLTTC